MNSVERLEAAFRHQVPDRVPVVAWLGLPLVQKLLPRPVPMRELYAQWADDPGGTIVKMQEDLGLDPIVGTASEHVGEWEIWPTYLESWPEDAMRDWQLARHVVSRTADGTVVEKTIATPEGRLSYTYRISNYSIWPLEAPLRDERDLELLKYRPDPARLILDPLDRMVRETRGRAFFTHAVSGVWNEAGEWRGGVNLALDIYDRPEWLHRLLRILTNRQIKMLGHLSETGIQAIQYSQDWAGIGLSPEHYREFILPYDVEVINAAKRAGLLVTYHLCGKGAHLLDLLVASGADALETLTAAGNGGDFDLAETKRRVGSRICLYGGFNERVFLKDDPQAVVDETRRCLEAAAEGGGYILRTAGQVFEARPELIRLMATTAREYGGY